MWFVSMSRHCCTLRLVESGMLGDCVVYCGTSLNEEPVVGLCEEQRHSPVVGLCEEQRHSHVLVLTLCFCPLCVCWLAGWPAMATICCPVCRLHRNVNFTEDLWKLFVGLAFSVAALLVSASR